VYYTDNRWTDIVFYNCNFQRIRLNNNAIITACVPPPLPEFKCAALILLLFVSPAPLVYICGHRGVCSAHAGSSARAGKRKIIEPYTMRRLRPRRWRRRRRRQSAARSSHAVLWHTYGRGWMGGWVPFGG